MCRGFDSFHQHMVKLSSNDEEKLTEHELEYIGKKSDQALQNFIVEHVKKEVLGAKYSTLWE